MHMIGISQVRLSGDRYEPGDGGKWAYISPARSADADSPYSDWHYAQSVLGGDLVDLVCWDTNTRTFATRCGAAEWLGCVERYQDTPIRRSVVDWLRHRCSGLMLLTQDPVRRYEILQECNDIFAANETHADELNAALAYPYPNKPIFIR